MTRRRDLMCEDIFNCEHKPEIPVADNGEISGWICACGKFTPVPEPKPPIVPDLRALFMRCDECGAVGEPDDHRHKLWCPKIKRYMVEELEWLERWAELRLAEAKWMFGIIPRTDEFKVYEKRFFDAGFLK